MFEHSDRLEPRGQICLRVGAQRNGHGMAALVGANFRIDSLHQCLHQAGSMR